MESGSAVVLAAFVAFMISVCAVWIHSGKRGLPPGPKGWPLIGNIFDIPKGAMHVGYMKMAKDYGSDVLYLNMAGSPMLILNSVEAVEDLLVRRAAIYSDRPRFPMIGELCGWDFALSLIKYGDQWRRSRALFAKQFSPSSVQAYHKPCIVENVHLFLNRLLNAPEEFQDHLVLLSAGIVLATTYGIYLRDRNNPYLQSAERAVQGFSEAALPGAYLINTFPILEYIPEWFPGAGFKRKAKVERANVKGMIGDTIEFVKKSMADGTARSSMASRALQEMKDDKSWSEEKETLLQNVAAALNTIILGLVLNPDVLRKGQTAVDAAIGKSTRLPNFDDEGKIPYVDALIMEGLRWRPIVPLGLPHYTTEEDMYRGYYVPANAIIIGNTWAILHDPATYGSNVDQFCPERFLNSDGTLSSKVPYPSAAFGYGRRICAGKGIAQHQLWIAVASLLACFDISQGVDGETSGAEAKPSTEYVNKVLSYPSPYRCNIEPRSKTVACLIRSS
ncbi:cytochrome P450 [Rhodocollybia butyracea]|uniref:Cytochrome P450 n=1 Tax=Rhodocollybia butyracea TaxID=206335 RepID=A0A9P5Q137_9AGAR|nr:cytochrome P450 [Rhodocollybia butyracea]